MIEKSKSLTLEQTQLLQHLCMTTIFLWKNAPAVHAWYGDDITNMVENLIVNVMEPRFMWGSALIGRTVH